MAIIMQRKEKKSYPLPSFHQCTCIQKSGLKEPPFPSCLIPPAISSLPLEPKSGIKCLWASHLRHKKHYARLKEKHDERELIKQLEVKISKPSMVS
jgi:hypothetical protein